MGNRYPIALGETFEIKLKMIILSLIIASTSENHWPLSKLIDIANKF